MANPNRPGAAAANTAEIAHPIDSEELRHRRLLSEAVLASFNATPVVLTPFSRVTLAWDVTMPTTLIPGVHVEVHLWGPGFDKVVEPRGTAVVFPNVETTYSVYVRTPLVVRELGVYELAVDFGTCKTPEIPASHIADLVTTKAKQVFPDGGGLTLRGNGARIDFGINAFVLTIPIEAHTSLVSADIDVTMGFSITTLDGRVIVKHDTASTSASFGALAGTLSAGCTPLIARAVELVSDGYLSFVGPAIAREIAQEIDLGITEQLNRLNVPNPPIPYKLFDLTLTMDALTLRFCPERPAGLGSTHPPHEEDPDPIPM